jgi:fermentation-respiration switch protein FrsA (DUF1100 family)
MLSLRLANAQLLYQNLAINILLVEYRGYGPSKVTLLITFSFYLYIIPIIIIYILQGVPSEKGLYLDAKAAFEFVANRPDLNPNKIFVFGRSLGGAVALNLCSRKEIRERVAGIIVENTFTSIPSLARKIFDFPGIKYLPRWFYSNKVKPHPLTPLDKVYINE